MRRERSQGSDRGRPHVPRWDNPSGQLPGTGIPSGIDSVWNCIGSELVFRLEFGFSC